MNFVCRKCSRSTGNAENDGDVTLHDDVTEKVTKFLHLDNILTSGGVQKAIIAGIKSARKSLTI